MTQKKSFKMRMEKLRFRYKLFILNQKTLEEVFHIELSRLTAIIYGFFTLIIVFFLLSIFIFLTPIKYYLPGFSDYSLRGEMSVNMSKLDSLSLLLHKQALQLQTAKNIISGNIPADSIPKQKEISIEKYKALAEKKSDKEQKFINNLQNNIIAEKSQGEKKVDETGKKILLPIGGTSKTIKIQNQPSNSLVITSNRGDVLAISKGVVVSCELTVDNRYTIAIQHTNGYVAIYKNLSKTLVLSDQNINIGDVIGNIDLKDNKPYLIFEIWQNGNSINPNSIFK